MDSERSGTAPEDPSDDGSDDATAAAPLPPGVAPMTWPALGRRHALSLAGLGLLGGVLAACGKGSSTAAVPERNDATAVTSKDAKTRLVSGNDRYVKGTPAHPDTSLARRKKLGEGQKPFAGILSCADSRVPPELVFDQGLGDLFVVRSAGQVVDRAVLGSLQFGVSELAFGYLVVLGHTKCGAVNTTVEAIQKKRPPTGTDVDAIVDAIRPSVKDAEAAGIAAADLAAAVIEFNVDRVVTQLEEAKLLMAAEKKRKLKIVGAVYDVDTGEVDFL